MRKLLLIVGILVLLSFKAEATPENIFYDFETGLQGWTTLGNAHKNEYESAGR